jgi:hypothetical protein
MKWRTVSAALLSSLVGAVTARKLDEVGPNLARALANNKPQPRRHLFLWTAVCQAGLPSLCICDEEGLRGAIKKAGSDPGNPTPIELCHGELEIEEEIDITGKSFFITCSANTLFNSCDLVGGKHTRLFTGAPVAAIFEKVRLTGGEANPEVRRITTAW